MFGKTMTRGLLAAALVASALSASADVFNMPSGDTSLQFVPVGNPGNLADTTGYGAVGYSYQMGKYDVTTAQYLQFLNAVATTADPYGLYNSNMNTGFASCGITRSGTAGNYSYSTLLNPNYPVDYVTWGDAARFCNWLDNGQPTGIEGNGTTETGAYAMNGATTASDLMAVLLPSHAGSTAPSYFLPTEDEWYKAAYYVGGGTNAGYWNYPTQSNAVPSNVLSATGTNNANFYQGGYTNPPDYLTPVGAFADSPGPYGTYDMGGDVWQWNEANVDGTGRGKRGASVSYNAATLSAVTGRGADDPSDDTNDKGLLGFRVAAPVSVPEPGEAALLLVAALFLAMAFVRRQSNRSGIAPPGQ